MTLQFTKMHGIGNDYIYVDCFTQSLEGIDPAALAVAISDRHRGVGSDGLILIEPPSPGAAADVRMVMFNADGSRGEMCGNGIRCVAKYAIEHGLVGRHEGTEGSRGQGDEGGSDHFEALPLVAELNMAVGGFLGDLLALNRIDARDIRIQTDRGVLTLTAFTANGVVRSVRVDMGEPILDPAKIPVELPRPHDGPLVRFPLDKYIPQNPPARWMEDCGIDLHMTCVSMGNPHMVVFCDHIDAVPLETLGPFFERQAIFPNRINVHFAQCLTPPPPAPPYQEGETSELRMRSWERGAGITQACGTGACAVLVAAVLEKRSYRQALMHLPGGDLRIEWPADGHVFMTGPAEEIFTGQWPI